MLIRFTAKNLFSFRDETEFNLFPNKTQRLSHHKIKKNNIDILRLSAIYGANGSGKSNLIKAISLLQSLVLNGSVNVDLRKLKFRLNNKYDNQPISFGIEFFNKTKIYYYTLTIDKEIILNEELYESNNENDFLIFERNFDKNIQTINFFKEYTKDEKNKFFIEVLAEKLLPKNELLISFLHENYQSEFEDVDAAFGWFAEILTIIKPNSKPDALADILDKNKSLKDFANDFITTLNIGISKIEVSKKKLSEHSFGHNDNNLETLIRDLEKRPNNRTVIVQRDSGEEVVLVYEKDEVFTKQIITSHLDNYGINIDFTSDLESDGTNRLIEFLPAFEGVLHHSRVYLIDEIERSIHPIIIKEIITKISHDEYTKGQLIFTTHESSLLDQDILRPDEIWFAQKDIDGASQLYSLSDFNIHHTANIENGYLNGRYGGIPFLSNLKELNWHKYNEVS